MWIISSKGYSGISDDPWVGLIFRHTGQFNPILAWLFIGLN